MSRKAAAPKLPPISEAEVQRNCLEILRARGVLAWRSNSRVFMVPGKGGRERPMRAGLGKGSADIVGILPGGRFLAVECKRSGKRPTPEQYAWLRLVNERGGLAFWVDSPVHVTVVLNAIERDPGRVVVIEPFEDGDQRITWRELPR